MAVVAGRDGGRWHRPRPHVVWDHAVAVFRVRGRYGDGGGPADRGAATVAAAILAGGLCSDGSGGGHVVGRGGGRWRLWHVLCRSGRPGWRSPRRRHPSGRTGAASAATASTAAGVRSMVGQMLHLPMAAWPMVWPTVRPTVVRRQARRSPDGWPDPIDFFSWVLFNFYYAPPPLTTILSVLFTCLIIQ